MPQVKLNLYATLRQYSGGSPSVEVDIEPGTTIEQLLAQLDIPSEKTRILFVNSRHARLSDTLQGGETVGVFPAVGGG